MSKFRDLKTLQKFASAHVVDQDHDAWPKIIVGCLDDILECGLEDVPSLTDEETPSRQEAAGLID